MHGVCIPTNVPERNTKVILYLKYRTKERQKTCPLCGHTHLVKNGYRIRDFIGLPIGGKKKIIRMKIQRYKCMNDQCTYDRQERIPFATDSCSYTHRFARYVIDLRTGRIIYVGDGKGADSLDRFWKKVRKKGLEIRYVATDLSAAFISSVSENCR